nr:EOG090X089S [Lepidurus arcticus]
MFQSRMMASIVPSLRCIVLPVVSFGVQTVQVRCFAARKGTRERKSKNKVKLEIKKEDFIPYKIKMAMKEVPTGSRRKDDTGKALAIDDVFNMKHCQARVFSFAKAVEAHRESMHPTVYARPDSILMAFVELDMRMEKKTRFLDPFSRIVLLPHNFSLGPDKNVLAFAKGQDQQREAIESGALEAGGPELVKKILMGNYDLSAVDFVVAHSNMLADMVSVRGLMKKKFPSQKAGTLGTDIKSLVLKFLKGLDYQCFRDKHELDYGFVEMPVGRLDMADSELEANLSYLLRDLDTCKPRKVDPFLTRLMIKCPPSSESFLVDHSQYVQSQTSTGSARSRVVDEVEEDEENADEEDMKERASS